MIKAEYREYPPIDAYRHWRDAFGLFARLVLFSMVNIPPSTKVTIIGNFIARATMALTGIFELWEIEDYPDCWALHRCMLDRLFHLDDLTVKDEFELFDDWSFMQQYDARNRIRSDLKLKTKIVPGFFRDTPEEKTRYQELSKNRPQWERPFAEDVAKRMKLEFLYKYGYDYGSTFVHSMANDGQFDFVILTRMGDKDEIPSQFVVIQNSCLVALLILQDAMRATGLRWRRIANNFLNDLHEFLENGSESYKLSLIKIAKLGPDVSLCEVPLHSMENK